MYMHTKVPLEENLAMIADSIAAIVAAGREAMFDCEHFFDGYKANPDYAVVCDCLCMCVCVCMSACQHVCLYVCISVTICLLSIYPSIHACMHACMHACIHPSFYIVCIRMDTTLHRLVRVRRTRPGRAGWCCAIPTAGPCRMKSIILSGTCMSICTSLARARTRALSLCDRVNIHVCVVCGRLSACMHVCIYMTHTHTQRTAHAGGGDTPRHPLPQRLGTGRRQFAGSRCRWRPAGAWSP